MYLARHRLVPRKKVQRGRNRRMSTLYIHFSLNAGQQALFHTRAEVHTLVTGDGGR